MKTDSIVHSPWPVLKSNDKRLHVDADELANAQTMHVARFFTDLDSGPDPDAGLNAQLLFGDSVRLLEKRGARARVRNDRDGYIGWIDFKDLSEAAFHPTHRVTAPRTFLYAEADMKKPRCGYRSMGSLVEVVGTTETRGTGFSVLGDGTAIFSGHLRPITNTSDDYVSVAEKLLRTPYLWGGNTGFGIDCSGLVQLSMLMTGARVLRDSDMQAATIGEPVDPGNNWQNLQRGDLVFWRGHVAIAQGDVDGQPHIIHANGHTMDVTSEPVDQAVERIAHLYEKPIGVRRLG